MAKIKGIDTEDFKREFKKTIESSNINLLLGAGFSYGICDTLGNIEKLMEAINKYDKGSKYTRIEAFLFWDFFKRTIFPLCNKINDSNLSEQIKFIKYWKQILYDRESALINKQVNIFTTNYDIILEYVFESTYTDYNDGFKGRMNTYFSTTNFNRLYFEKTLFTNRSVEVPIFNLLKLHGSVSWNIERTGEKRIVYNDYKTVIKEFYESEITLFDKTYKSVFANLEKNLSFIDYKLPITDVVLDKLVSTSKVLKLNNKCIAFIKSFKDRFKIVSPTKQKFSDTLMDKNYYELMRIYSNELEKSNTVLIVFGFSFDDEHIEEITKRSLSNPSLIVVLFAYSDSTAQKYQEKFNKYENVWIIKTHIEIKDNTATDTVEEKKLNLGMLNKCLNEIFGDK